MTLSPDLILRGGAVVDGSGAEPFRADVGVRDGRIFAVGDITGGGAEEIDVRGKLVTPGFVDLHTHYDGQVTWENRLAPSSNHGVTTVVMGNCGVGFAPCRPGEQELAIKLMEGVEDIPEVVMSAGIPWNWETFPQYLDALSERRTDVDFAAQLPHSPLRVFVMGERGAEREPPTDSELAEMRRLTTEAIQAGAVGVSTSRQLAHRFRDGKPAPSVNTEVDEIMALAEGLRDAGAGVFQIITNTDNPPESEFALMRRLAETCGRPLSFSLPSGPGRDAYLDALAGARRDGLPMRAQFIPRPIGMLFGLDLSYHPFALNPSYRQIENLPLAEKVRAMRDPGFRAKLLAEEPQDSNPFLMKIVGQRRELYPLGDPPNYTPAQSDSIAAKAMASGVSERELIYDELLARDGHAILLCPLGMGYDRPKEVFQASGTVIGLGDGGAHYGMICDASYPTYVLTRLTRDAAANEALSVGAAIRALTRAPAEAIGFLDRGLVAPGLKADLNVIDFQGLQLHAPSVARDLPAGGRRLSQKSEGYELTMVSGEITYRQGQPTGALPGRLVRGPRPST